MFGAPARTAVRCSVLDPTCVPQVADGSKLCPLALDRLGRSPELRQKY